MTKDSPQTRRSFLRAAARMALLGGLGGLAAALTRRNPACRRRYGCDGCVRYAQCALPQKAGRP